MTSRSPKGKTTRSSTFTVSLILGLLLIPLSAVAAAALISNGEGTDSEVAEIAVVAAAVPETVVTTAEPESVETVIVTEAPTFTREDLESACGEQGWELVEREIDGTIGELEQAALDSLRQICADEGLELPGPPAPPAIVRTVSVVDPSSDSPTTTMPDDSSDSSSDDDEYDDDEYEDEHDEEDDEDEHDEDGHDEDEKDEDDD